MIGVLNVQINVKFDMQLSSIAAELHAKYHTDLNIKNTYIYVSRLHKIYIKTFYQVLKQTPQGLITLMLPELYDHNRLH